MRLYNQTKHNLRWDMSGHVFTAEPWGHVHVPDEFVDAVKSRGLPLDIAPVPPEARAKVRIADQAAADQEAPLRALKAQLDDAQASERSAKEELERMSVELSKARADLRSEQEQALNMLSEIERMKADLDAANKLVAEHAAKAAASEERAIKAEAVKAETEAAPKKKS
jgi:hypothetical protein